MRNTHRPPALNRSSSTSCIFPFLYNSQPYLDPKGIKSVRHSPDHVYMMLSIIEKAEGVALQI